MKDIVSAALVVLCLLFVYISDGRQQTSVFPNELYGSVPVYTDSGGLQYRWKAWNKT